MLLSSLADFFFSLELKTFIKLEKFCSKRSKQGEKHAFWLASFRPRILLNLCFNHWHFMQPSIIKNRVFTQNVSYASNICFVKASLTVPRHWRSSFIPGELRPDRLLPRLLCSRKPSVTLARLVRSHPLIVVNQRSTVFPDLNLQRLWLLEKQDCLPAEPSRSTRIIASRSGFLPQWLNAKPCSRASSPDALLGRCIHFRHSLLSVLLWTISEWCTSA